MDRMKVEFTDGRSMIAEPGTTFTGTDMATGRSVEYVCFTDHRTTGPLLAKRRYVYYFKLDYGNHRIIYSDHDSSEEFEFVKKTLAKALDCAPKGLLCLFELVRGGVKKVEFI